MELWDIVDKDRRPTGKTIMRGEKLSNGDYHQVVHVCLFNTSDQLLIQERTHTKQEWPGMYDVSVGGSALANETSRQAAMRETLEELGLYIDLENIDPICTVMYPNIFDDFYCLIVDIDDQSLSLQEDEVKSVKWASLDEVKELVKKGSFIPYNLDFISYLFSNKDHHGVIR